MAQAAWQPGAARAAARGRRRGRGEQATSPARVEGVEIAFLPAGYAWSTIPPPLTAST